MLNLTLKFIVCQLSTAHMTSIINLAFEVAASVMGCTPYYMPSKVDNLRYCNGDEATDFVKV